MLVATGASANEDGYEELMDMILDELQDVSVLHSSVEACKVWGHNLRGPKYIFICVSRDF